MTRHMVKSKRQSMSIIESGLSVRYNLEAKADHIRMHSYTIITLSLHHQAPTTESRDKGTWSKLVLVDIASSQLGNKDTSPASITSTFQSLSRVLSALASHQNRPLLYKDSKLTRALRDTLSTTILCAFAAPSIHCDSLHICMWVGM
jgi:hypothetical protein